MIPEEELPSLRDPEFLAKALDAIAGTYVSGWGSMKNATTSLLMTAGVQTGELIRYFDVIEAKTESAAEASFYLTLNFDERVKGPALGTVLLAAMCTEALLRTVFVVATEMGSARSSRRAAISDQVLERFQKFDALSAKERFSAALVAAGCVPIAQEDPLYRDFEFLIEFRNACAHDTPALNTDRGTAEQPGRNRKSPRADSPDEIGPFKRLGRTLREVRLIHALLACEIHDGVLSRLLAGVPDPELWRKVLKGLAGPTPRLGILDALPKNASADMIRSAAQLWEQELEPRAKAGIEGFEDFIQGAKRKLQVKLVREDGGTSEP